MLEKIGSFMGLRERDRNRSAVEIFGETKVARSLGEEILKATLDRRNWVRGIKDCLTSMTPEEKDALVDRVLVRLALFVFDLPASESHHHSRQFGLLDHLLEVACETAGELSSPGFQVSPDPAVNHREGPLWVYAGVVAAIAHDIGKPLDLDVTLPGASRCWDPKTEPLRLFCERHGQGGTGPLLWHFHPQRGTDNHERHIGTLLPLVLTPEVQGYLGPRLPSVLSVLSSNQEWSTSAKISPTAREVVRVVRRFDESTALEDLKQRGGTSPGPRPGGGGAFCAPELRPHPPVAVPAQEPRPEAGPFILLPAPAIAPLGGPLGSEDEAPSAAPSDYYEETVPDPKDRRGDPVENRRRLSVELDPARFLDTIRRLIIRGRLTRNNLCTHVYIRPDYVWLVIPRALRRIATSSDIPFDAEVAGLMLGALRLSPHVETKDASTVPVYMRPRLESRAFKAVRLKTRGFLSESDVAQLGIHAFDVRIVQTDAFFSAVI